jgi:hypothetical protein
MKTRPDDTTEVVVALPPDLTPPPAPPIDGGVLRRALRHGTRARPYFPAWSFEEAESELRAGWLLNGETARWRDVREAVREGFEDEPDPKRNEW